MTSSPFLGRVRDFMAVRRYSPRIIKYYSYWKKNYIIFNGKQHPSNMGAIEVEESMGAESLIFSLSIFSDILSPLRPRSIALLPSVLDCNIKYMISLKNLLPSKTL